jgi:hypothetical protein
MTDPQHLADQHLADHAWKDAAALAERVEQAARSNVSSGSFFEDLATGLRLTSAASAVVVWVSESSKQTVLARSGITIHDDTRVDFDSAESDHSPQSQWNDGPSHKGDRLRATQRVNPEVHLGLDLRFDQAVKFSLRQPLGELAEVILDLATTVYLRSSVNDLRAELQHRTNRDALISRLNEGIGLTDSFASIASAIASETAVDRVSLLRRKAGQYQLITTSTQPKVDRRARAVRLLETLTATALDHADGLTFTVGAPGDVSPEISSSVESYLHESGCREIRIESICRDEQDDDPIAAIVLERFRISPDKTQAISLMLSPIRQPVRLAIRNAIGRDDAGWGLIASRFSTASNRRKALFFAIGLTVLLLASCLIQAPLKIPVEGRIVATDRSRLFAPTEGIVTEVLVSNGQAVRKGDTLVVLNSPNLDLQQRNIEGTLATAQTRLDTLFALRSRGSSARQQETNVSADEQVLKAEISGLQKQLKLIQSQQRELTIRSLIDGTVDRWDLQQSLAARPVTHGQYLLDVISGDHGWTVELDLPEQNVNYVLDQQQRCRCSFRMRSNPTKTFEGVVVQIADVAHLNPAGQSVVRLTVPIETDLSAEIRSGATVVAQLECGRRAIGFVLFRGLIQWWRSQPWF